MIVKRIHLNSRGLSIFQSEKPWKQVADCHQHFISSGTNVFLVSFKHIPARSFINQKRVNIFKAVFMILQNCKLAVLNNDLERFG